MQSAHRTQSTGAHCLAWSTDSSRPHVSPCAAALQPGEAASCTSQQTAGALHARAQLQLDTSSPISCTSSLQAGRNTGARRAGTCHPAGWPRCCAAAGAPAQAWSVSRTLLAPHLAAARPSRPVPAPSSRQRRPPGDMSGTAAARAGMREQLRRPAPIEAPRCAACCGHGAAHACRVLRSTHRAARSGQRRRPQVAAPTPRRRPDSLVRLRARCVRAEIVHAGAPARHAPAGECTPSLPPGIARSCGRPGRPTGPAPAESCWRARRPASSFCRAGAVSGERLAAPPGRVGISCRSQVDGEGSQVAPHAGHGQPHSLAGPQSSWPQQLPSSTAAQGQRSPRSTTHTRACWRHPSRHPERRTVRQTRLQLPAILPACFDRNPFRQSR